METKKIAFACFVGGVIYSAVAYFFSPNYWWFGLLAGIVGGYLSYEFREVLKAIPIAFHYSKNESIAFLGNAVRKERKWLSQPHPFFNPAVLVVSPLFIFGLYFAGPLYEGLSLSDKVLCNGLLFICAVTWFFNVSMVVSALFYGLVVLGTNFGKYGYFQEQFHKKDRKNKIKEMKKKGYKERPLTSFNVMRWSMLGVGVMIYYLTWKTPMYLIVYVCKMIVFISGVAWQLFRLIHSEKRVLCAIDGTLGGAVSYLCFYSTDTSSLGIAVFIFFGGLLGAAFGVANWEIVSKRILHVPCNREV